MFLIMKQKTRFENIGYQPMNGRYIGIGLKKTISVNLCYISVEFCQYDTLATSQNSSVDL